MCFGGWKGRSMKLWMSQAGSSGLVDADSARVNPFDHGVTVGDGAFETLKVIDGQAFAVQRHIGRLNRSAQILGLQRVDAAEIRLAIQQVINANLDCAALGRLRITLTSGEGPLGSDRSDSLPTIIVALVPIKPWPATTSAIFTPWKRNEHSAIVGAKSTSYAENVVALGWARERGFSEGLFTSTSGQVSEGTGSNIFIVKDGEICTPALSSGCLAGITRELVIEWCGAHERDVTIDECLAADEVLLTSSTRDVHPVTLLNERSWSSAGPVTRRVMQEFSERSAAQIDP
jgi:branched-chain amino acid aminotransferase